MSKKGQPRFIRSISSSALRSIAQMAMASVLALNGVKLATTSQAYVESKAAIDTKALLSELSHQFYGLRWVSGTGGNIAIKVHYHSIPKRQKLTAMSPSGGHFSIFISRFQFFCSYLVSCIFWPFCYFHCFQLSFLDLFVSWESPISL